MPVWAYDKFETDFTANGIGLLEPAEGIVTEESNGMYELQMKHPVDSADADADAPLSKWRRIERGTIISVPVGTRTLPEIVDNAGTPQIVTTIEQWETTQKAKVRQKASNSSKALRELKAGTQWYVTLKQGAWYKGRDQKGRSGWLRENQLRYVQTNVTPPTTSAIEQVIPASFTSQQLFRVYRVEWTTDEVTVYARHITYDFQKNLIGLCTLKFIDGYSALNTMLGLLYVNTDFECFTDLTASNGYVESVEWSLINPIKALFDPDVGFCGSFNAQAVRDNYSIYLLKQSGIDRGFKVSYAKNMTGINWDENEEGVVTRIIPVGQNQNGEPLLLPEGYIDSPRINDYPNICCMTLDVPDAQVSATEEGGVITEGITLEMAYDMLRQACYDQYEVGIDLPELTIDVDFVNLGDTEEFAPFKELQQVYMHDVVHIDHSRLGLSYASTVVKTEWDFVLGRYKSLRINTSKPKLRKLKVFRFASSQLPLWFSGSFIANGTIQSKALGAGAVSGSQLAQGSVGSSAIANGAVKDQHLLVNAVQMDKITGLPAALQNIDTRLKAGGL